MKRAIKVLPLFFMLFLLFSVGILMAQPHGNVAAKPGKQLVVGVLHDPPYIMKEKDGTWTGLNVDIWKAVAQDLKVNYEFKEMTFKGLIDALKNNTVDIAIETFFVLAERENLIDYSVEFGNTGMAVATQRDKISHPWWAAIKVILSWGTLKTIGLLCLILCFLGFLFWLIERKTNPDHFGGGVIRGVGTGIYWVGSTLASGVCFGIALKSLPARILGLIWMFVCAIALSALIASLTSSLYANRSMTETVNEETLRHMRLGGIKESAESIALKKLGGKYVLYQDEVGALKAVLRGETEGFLYDEITLHYYKDNDYKDKISVYPTNSQRFMFAFGLPKESPLRRKVNYALLSLMEKPDWVFLLKRYGLDQNFEQSQAAIMRRGRR